jgi:hypothetical protein
MSPKTQGLRKFASVANNLEKFRPRVFFRTRNLHPEPALAQTLQVWPWSRRSVHDESTGSPKSPWKDSPMSDFSRKQLRKIQASSFFQDPEFASRACSSPNSPSSAVCAGDTPPVSSLDHPTAWRSTQLPTARISQPVLGRTGLTANTTPTSGTDPQAHSSSQATTHRGPALWPERESLIATDSLVATTNDMPVMTRTRSTEHIVHLFCQRRA